MNRHTAHDHMRVNRHIQEPCGDMCGHSQHVNAHAQHTDTHVNAAHEPYEHTRAHTEHRDGHGNTQHMTRTAPNTHTRRQPHRRSRGSCRRRAHMRHSAAPSLGVGSCTARCGGRKLCAGSLRGSSGRLGEGAGERGVSTRWAHALPRPPSRQGTHGHSRGSRGSLGCTPGRWHPRSWGGSGTPRPPHTAGPGHPGGRRRRLQRTRGQALGACGWPSHPARGP